MNTIDRIQMLIETDEEDRTVQERHLRQSYAQADESCKQAIDAAFIALCGYGLGTLMGSAGT